MLIIKKSGGFFDLSNTEKKLSELKKKTTETDFWKNNETAKNILKKISFLENKIKEINKMDALIDDINIYFNLFKEDSHIYNDLEKEVKIFNTLLDNIKIKSILNKKEDKNSCILSIHPGAGGTESQDWAEMLYRLYKRWAEKRKYNIKILDFQPGDEAGIKDISIEVIGDYSYGYLKSEVGVHRLIRISPFDSNHKRHTSFCSVFVYPILENNSDIIIKEEELRIDTYKSSGAGGQHVNKTDSAVRIVHLPTNIVVQCQNQRSQIKNKATALKILKAKLYQIKLEESNKFIDEAHMLKTEISWGNQIRSYIFHPYNLVKDHRTKIESTNINNIMDGDIDKFINEFLLNNS